MRIPVITPTTRATAERWPAPLPGADRIVVTAALMTIAALSWVYLFVLDRSMTGMQMNSMMTSAVQPVARPWATSDFALTFIMWWVMMTGMMLPAALPMVMMFARVNQNKRKAGKPYVPVVVFAGAYLLAWGIYSLAATATQWGLESVTLLQPTGSMASPVLGGTLFLAAGIYQFMPLKHVCLRQCRSPLGFVLNSWRDGVTGALAMGMNHGFYCLGCCWILMALLFAVGVMNLLWVAVIVILVLAEKLLPAGAWIARVSGTVMCAYGVSLIASV